VVQGSVDRAIRPDCLTPDFRAMVPAFEMPRPFRDRLRNLQVRDASVTKIPRALRFNDRVSMRASTELREPFLDHRLFELALRQPDERKIHGSMSKWMLRQIAGDLLPQGVGDAPKRPVQTPQREWLRGPLAGWAEQHIEQALSVFGGTWFDSQEVRDAWQSFRSGAGDNSFYVWQWINTGLMFTKNRQRNSIEAPRS
jgi:asparagine synthase (glutamine-hydrolysing)